MVNANEPNVTWSDPIKDSDGTADHHFVGTVDKEFKRMRATLRSADYKCKEGVG